MLLLLPCILILEFCEPMLSFSKFESCINHSRLTILGTKSVIPQEYSIFKLLKSFLPVK